MESANNDSNDSLNLSADRFEMQEKPNNIKKILAAIAMFLLVVIGIFSLMYVFFLEYYQKKENDVKETKYTINETVPEFSLPKPEPKPELKPEPVIKPKPVIVHTPTVIQKLIKADPNIAIRARQMKPQLGSPINKESAISSANAFGLSSQATPNLGLSSTSNKSSGVKIISAKQLPNLTYLITKGTPIPCALNTAIQSDQAGMITCTVNEDIYSANGSTILIDRGSFVTGEYRIGSLTIGKGRIFAIWDRIRMPSGAVIELDSYASDSLGRAGIGGDIDNHYMERFGIAFLVSLIDNVVYNATHDGGNISIQSNENTRDRVGSAVADDILKDLRRIRPTLYQHQGAAVNIMVSHDLDFSSVYKLNYVN